MNIMVTPFFYFFYHNRIQNNNEKMIEFVSLTAIHQPKYQVLNLIDYHQEKILGIKKLLDHYHHHQSKKSARAKEKRFSCHCNDFKRTQPFESWIQQKRKMFFIFYPK